MNVRKERKRRRTSRSASRPRGDARRSAILAAATEAFLAHGYEGATLDQVIAKAGGSRATLYAAFGDKEGLFAAIIADVCATMLAPLEASIQAGGDPAAVLTRFGRQFMTQLMDPTNVALYRLVIGASRRFPALGARVFTAGPENASERLADYLKEETRRGRLHVAKPATASRAFLEMIKGELHTRALFGGSRPTAAEIDATVRTGVQIFLTGVAQK